MNANSFKVSCLATSLAMAFMMSAHAQTTGTVPPPGAKSAAPSSSGSATAPSTGAMSSGASSSSSSSMSKSAANGDLPRADKNFISKAAQGGLAEVQLGQLAAQKASDPQVKQFAQRMVDDHSKANDKLKQVASSKNVTLPTDLPSDAKREEDKLNKLSGAQFDREYMNHMLSDHKKDVSLFRSQAKSGKDSEVKQFASDTLPTLEQHLQMAQTIAKSK